MGLTKNELKNSLFPFPSLGWAAGLIIYFIILGYDKK